MTHSITAGQLKNYIEEELINPIIETDIEKLIKSRNMWKSTSNICETTGQVLLVGSTILTFASSVYKNITLLSFVAGCTNVSAISLLKFSTYAANESIERSKSLNDLLVRCKIEPLPISNNVATEVTPLLMGINKTNK